MDVDNTNPTVGQGATDESTLDDQLVAAFDEISESLPQNGADGDGDGGADGADEGDGSESSLDDDLGDGGTETDETDDPGDNDPGETDDDDAGQGESANDVPDAAGEGEPSEKSVEPEPPKPEPKPDRKTERTLKAVKEYAESLGYNSVEAMLADQEGVDVETVKARLESEELTVEEKAALYDAEHAKSKEAEKADAERRGREAVLQALYADFPTIKDTVKDLDKDIKNPDRFLKLLLAGASPREAFLATGNVPPRSAPVPNGKSHLLPNVRTTRGGGSASIPVADLAIYREEFPDLSDGKIEALYKKVSS